MQLVDVGMTSMVISEVSENYNPSHCDSCAMRGAGYTDLDGDFEGRAPRVPRRYPGRRARGGRGQAARDGGGPAGGPRGVHLGRAEQSEEDIELAQKLDQPQP